MIYRYKAVITTLQGQNEVEVSGSTLGVVAARAMRQWRRKHGKKQKVDKFSLLVTRIK